MKTAMRSYVMNSYFGYRNNGSGLSTWRQIAMDSLAAMTDVAPFDMVFIDADKQRNVDYVAEAIRLGRSGTTIIVDNVVREGGVLDPASKDPGILGTRALFDFLQAHPRIDATAVQTVGAKGWDGFVLARVV